MKCSVFIATSADGYIATEDGNVDWLHTAGKIDANMSANPDMGFDHFIKSVDCMIMGRKCMEVISSMNLTPEQWPYRNIKVYVLSHSITKPPENLRDQVEIFSGDIRELISNLENEGYQHAYVDGGSTITSFINVELINEMTITKVPVILGAGIPLFGNIKSKIRLENSKAITFPNDYIQIKYSVKYTTGDE